MDICGTKSMNSWFEKINIFGKNINFKVDTGAETNLLPLNLWKKIGDKRHLSKCNTQLKSVTG